MSAKTLTTDSWQGPRNLESELADPTPEQIVDSIRRLDAEQYTLVMLETGDEVHMAVGGGSGQYVAYVTFDNVKFHQLATGDESRSEVRLCVGGQEGVYEQDVVVDEATAIRAALHFAETGELDATCRWRTK